MPAAIYPKQVELYMKAKQNGLSQETAAAKAGISKRTPVALPTALIDPIGSPERLENPSDPLDGLWETELLPMQEKNHD